MLTRVLLSIAIVAMALGHASAQSWDSRFIFRYKAAAIPAAVETPHPGDFDVTARFFGIVGEAFDSKVPTKPGAVVSRWEIERGFLPDGLTFDPSTGTITGTPTETAEARILAVNGLAPSGEMGTYASVQIDVIEPRGNSLRQVFLSHTGKPFRHEIDKTAGVPVYEWVPVIPLPSWASTSAGGLEGLPDAAGVWAVAFSGLDHNGQEIAFTYGQLLVEDGPTVAFIPDQVRHQSNSFSVVPSVGWSFGELR